MTTREWNETVSGILTTANATTTDATKLALNISNGECQHIFSLGTFGFVVCNHKDKKIVLVDPWPTHYSGWIDAPSCKPRKLMGLDNPDLARNTAERNRIIKSNRAKDRISGLASFLRCANEEGYEISAILLSHMHFDHCDDVVLLLELLIAESAIEPDGVFDDIEDVFHDRKGRTYNLKGAPIALAGLPRLVADFDTIFFIQAVGFGSPLSNFFDSTGVNRNRYFKRNPKLKAAAADMRRHLPGTLKPNHIRWHQLREKYCVKLNTTPLKNASWIEVGDKEGNRVIYDDSYNEQRAAQHRTLAGKLLKPFSVGSFKVQPFVYDHINVGFGHIMNKQLDDQNSGDLQRISAFRVQAASDAMKRSTLFIGSSGEMNQRWTGAVNNDLFMETDLLIYAAFRGKPADVSPAILDALADTFFLNFTAQIEAGMKYLVQHIQVNEAVVFAHFEEFMTKLRDTRGYQKDAKEAIPFILRLIKIHKNALKRDGSARKVTHARRWEQLFEDNRFYVLARRGKEFDATIPESAVWFEQEKNRYVQK